MLTVAKGVFIGYSIDELVFIEARKALPRKQLHIDFIKKFKRDDVSAINLKALCKRKGWMTGRTGCFDKGHVPDPKCFINKGPNKTSFKKGTKPHNWRPVGSTRVNSIGYLQIKTAEPKTWEDMHILIWSEANGEIPHNHCVSFKDGNTLNCVLDNLELISRNTLLHINKLQPKHYPKEMQQVLRTMGKLLAKTAEIKQ